MYSRRWLLTQLIISTPLDRHERLHAHIACEIMGEFVKRLPDVGIDKLSPGDRSVDDVVRLRTEVKKYAANIIRSLPLHRLHEVSAYLWATHFTGRPGSHPSFGWIGSRSFSGG
ncbi:unnamed protein product [Cyclocybe aegerita]|uniref:Uncharacterized protein n=1 Tax=Cyclocybe aegerita TaxID=1973307 RepID=A0A8S0VYE9_CYCAE|nr:unnamed protein product [Cyclocybe aegerita]